jgi:hypothetical protein
LIDLEIAGVDDDTERSANSESYAVDGAVSDGDEFDFERANLDQAAGKNFAKGGGFEEAGLFEALLHQSQRKACAIDWNVQVTKDVRKSADVILVAVSEDDGANVLAILLEVGDVGNDEVNAEKLRFWEHHAGVDDDDVVPEAQGHHVHAKFAETAERNGCKGMLGLAQ